MSGRTWPNKWPGTCVNCGLNVPAYEGVRVRNADGTYHTEHRPSCTAATPEPVGEVIGTWTVGDVTMTLTGDPNYQPRRARG